ncbi:sentrin-specific protease 7-like isoform X4 [Cynoglossus semilaevis]|uniref:sentrin-specific protease 7-like isoform X4 n=1 Tax=Cynoglossus semilaevis TaxID=244447 RepID=UPI000D623657|nr:sentrin-specific protease 7-like isoform X4 [Cynoglossus semilaevis]XP_024918184.1 sentrin-specific protease 7-like isoform X4 [Cynoglossus semilaevis]XP_024918185.1 sentrin-specific protease 7-like isoform X4 [Cynoglossus semilaevis]
MASQFKIPKRKYPSDGDSAYIQSPLARLDCPSPQLKNYVSQPNRVNTKKGGRMSRPTVFKDVVEKLLGIGSLQDGEESAENTTRKAVNSSAHRAVVASVSNRWRPHRASDRLLRQEVKAQLRLSTPPQRKVVEPSVLSVSVDSVDSVDTLVKFRAQRPAGKCQSKNLRPGSVKRPFHSTQSSSEEDFVLGPSPPKSASMTFAVSKHSPERLDTDRTPKVDFRKRDQQRRLQLRTRKDKRREGPTEPIVLSSEEEEEEDDDDDDDVEEGAANMSQSKSSGTAELPGLSSDGEHVPVKGAGPACLQLDFSSLHIGLTEVKANGKMMVTEKGLVIPVKVSAEEDGDVTIVASQLRGYGVWDGGMASGGALLGQWEGPSPSVLFLWVTDAQANLLQRELSAMMTLTTPSTTTSVPCCCLLLVMKEQLKELQTALLASMLDLEEYRKGRSSSSSCCSSPVNWADGLMLVHSCPPPLDQHLLSLLGHADISGSGYGSGSGSGLAKKSLRNTRSSLDSPDLQKLPNRLIQYPPPPSKGSITVTKEDLACLDAGEFLNDVIIDFYLKFLLLEAVDQIKTERSHVFSSFFYRQLSRRRVAGEDSAPSVPNCHTRHQRVKTWTRHVDIFTKDFLFVPVNQEAHWFLVVVCFPGLEDVQFEEFHRPAGKLSSALKSHQLPECTQQGCGLTTVLKRPCILVMDSLKMSNHENVCRLIREYLQVEWKVRRGTNRIFTADNMRSSSCRVPQQDNSSDCGVYLLQYAQSFLQNPVVNFELPCRLDLWFPRQLVRQKRKEIRHLILKLHNSQRLTPEKNRVNIPLNQNTACIFTDCL